MKQLLSFIRKEFHHVLRDRTTIMILLIMPIIQIILFGFALTNEVKNTNVVVLADNNDAASQQIIDKINGSDYFEVTGFVHNSAEINAAFRDGKAKLAVIFEDNFSQNLKKTGKANVQLIADATDPNAATSFVFYASNIITAYQQDLTPLQTAGGVIQPEVKMLYNPQMISAYNFVPGVLGMILILICAMMTSIAIVR